MSKRGGFESGTAGEGFVLLRRTTRSRAIDMDDCIDEEGYIAGAVWLHCQGDR